MKAFKQFFVEQSEEKTLMILVGPPAIGKSTWIEQNAPDAFVINRDDIVIEVAKRSGMTYDDLFAAPDKELPIGHVDDKYGEVIAKPEGFPPFLPDTLWDKVVQANNDVAEVFKQRFPEAVKSGQDIIIDMTNMSVGARKGIIGNFEGAVKDYKKVAVVFNFEGSDLQKAIKKVAGIRAKEIKAQGGSKTIPDSAFDRMFASYEPISPTEGFDEVINIDDSQRLLQSL